MFLCFMEYESMELDTGMQCLRFTNVRLQPQPPLITEADSTIVWPNAMIYYARTDYENMALISRNGVIRRIAVHRPCLTIANHGTRTVIKRPRANDAEDPIEEWD